jgi:hypothetical protein
MVEILSLEKVNILKTILNKNMFDLNNEES